MTDTPTRWKRDPSFLDETGCDLADELATLDAPDLPALRARIVRGVPPSGGGGGGAARWPARVGLASAGLGAALLAGWLASPRPDPIEPDVVATDVARSSTEAPPEAEATRIPTVAVPGPFAHEAPVPPMPVRRDPSKEATGHAAPRIRGGFLVGPGMGGPGAGPAAQVGASGIPVRAPGPQPGSAPPTDLDAQRDAVSSAERALAAGDAATARQRFQAYLARWPEGALRGEARRGLVRAIVSNGDADEILRVTDRFAGDPDLDVAEVRRARAEALAALDRCDEALALADGLDRLTAAKVHSSCGTPSE